MVSKGQFENNSCKYIIFDASISWSVTYRANFSTNVENGLIKTCVLIVFSGTTLTRLQTEMYSTQFNYHYRCMFSFLFISQEPTT